MPKKGRYAQFHPLSSVSCRGTAPAGADAAETIYALGKGDLLVGRSDYCNYPEEALALPSVGTLYSPSLEKLLSLEPTLAISSAFISDQMLASIEQAGVDVLQIDTQESFAGTCDLIRLIGEAVDAEDQAELLILSMQNTVREVQLKAQDGPKPTVYMAFDFGSFDSAATADTFLSEMIALAGGDNVCIGPTPRRCCSSTTPRSSSSPPAGGIPVRPPSRSFPPPNRTATCMGW